MNRTEKWGLFKKAASQIGAMAASSVVSGAFAAIFAIADVVTGKEVSNFKKVTRAIGGSLVGGYVGAQVEKHISESLDEYDMAFEASEGADVIEYVTAKTGE